MARLQNALFREAVNESMQVFLVETLILLNLRLLQLLVEANATNNGKTVSYKK